MDYKEIKQIIRQIFRIIAQTLILWIILSTLNMLSAILSLKGLLFESVLDDVGGTLIVTGIIAVIQGSLIGFRKKSSIIILPLFITLIQLSMIISSINKVPGPLDMTYEVVSLWGFLFCPYVEIFKIEPGLLNTPLAANQIVWCFQNSIFIGLYLFAIFWVTKNIMGWLIRNDVFEAPAPRVRNK